MGARPGSNNNGGPRTPEGRARALANLRPDAGTKHGLFVRARPPRCDTCAGASECSGYTPGGSCDPAAVRAQIAADVMALPHIRDDELPQVERYAELLLRVEMPWLWPGRYAWRRPRGLDRLRRELGLTPLSLCERRRREARERERTQRRAP